ncbi:MAG: insulinase family protein [Bacteroidaceae bacterium]|nr:insulinase family protein [Bacteroidaceae bacterium]
MKKIIFSLVLLLSVVIAFAQPLPLDPAVRYGTLPNGLTYYLRYNNWPEQRADFYIAQRVGSIQEEDNQRGLAHFLEHMCFNGTTHFPGDRIKTYLEEIGVRFGENLNAYTSFDETVYNINNVNVKIEGAIDTCLLILHDWSHDLLLEGEEIDKERGVINEEWRARTSAMMRMYETALPELYPGSRYGHRLPIGTMDIVMNFPYEALRSYYRKWYRPDLQAIIIVGDIDVDAIESKIKDVFADIAPAPADAAKFERYPVPDNSDPIVTINKDKEYPPNNISLFWKVDPFPRENNTEYMVFSFLTDAMSSMFAERRDDIVQKPDVPFISMDFGYNTYFISKTKEAFQASVMCRENQYKEGLQAFYREVLRAKRFGFTTAEFERFKADYLSRLERAYLHRDKVQSSNYVHEYVRHFIDHEPSPGIEVEYALMNQIVPSTTVEMVNHLFALMPDSNFVVAMFGADKPENHLPTKQELLDWLAEVEKEDIQPLEDTTSNQPLISSMPAPGTVKKIKDEIYGAKLIVLSNGVKIHVKQTDFSPNQISFFAQSFGGNSLYSDDEYLQTSNVGGVKVGGLGNFSATDLNKILAGKQVSANAFVGIFAEGIQGSCVKKDFETLLQLVYLTFTAPRKDQEAFDALINRTKETLRNQEMQPTIALVDTVAKVIYKNHPRAVRIRPADLDSLDYDRLIQIYRERFADGDDFEFFIVGDCNADSIAPLLAKYLGALPTLPGKEKFKIITLRDPKGEIYNVFEKEQETPRAIVNFSYHTKMKPTLRNGIIIDMIQQLMDMLYTETVREDEGGAYGVPVRGSIVRYPEDEAAITISLTTAPEKRAKMTEIIYQGIDQFVANGPNPENVQKVKEYMLRRHAEQLKNNGYWMNRMIEHAMWGDEVVKPFEKTLNSITPADIQKVAKAIFRSGNHCEVGMTTPIKE